MLWGVLSCQIIIQFFYLNVICVSYDNNLSYCYVNREASFKMWGGISPTILINHPFKQTPTTQPHTKTPPDLETYRPPKWAIDDGVLKKPLHKCSYKDVEGVLNSDNSVTFYGIVFETINEAINYIDLLGCTCKVDVPTENNKIEEDEEYSDVLWLL